MVLSKYISFLRYRIFVITILIAVLSLSASQQSYATHAAGSDLTYRCLSGNQYEIEVSFYRDCAGIDAPSLITIFYRSVTCGFNLNVTAVQVPNSGVEVTVPCTSSASTCNNGVTTGIKKFLYRAVVNLPANCSDWIFSYSVCCRNCSITTIDNPCGTGSNLYVEAKLNNLAAPQNSSPTFSNNPIAFVCVGQNFNFNQGVFDVDADSLSYSLITPKTSATTEVQFISPANVSNPVASSTPFIINPITGDLNFTPSQIQIGILAILVQEYRNGQLIGSVIRDIQIYAAPCFNNLPVVTGINGTNNFSMTVCPGQAVCFDIFANDADSMQSVTMTTNNGIPGSVFTISGTGLPTGTFCWTPGYDDVDLLPKTITVTVTDNNCPTNGQQTFSYSIFVPSPFFNFTTIPVSCHGGSDGSAIVNPVYGNIYNYSWNTIPVQHNAAATSLSSGTYMLTVSDTNLCSLTIPVIISEPDEMHISSVINPTSCNGLCNGSIDLSISGGIPGYSYNWNTGSISEDLSGLCNGIYTVTVTDLNGCSIVEQYSVQDVLQLTTFIDVTDVTCFGNSDGVANLTVTGGVQPLNYLWSNGATTEDISGVVSGVYSVVILDANFCATTAYVYVDQPASLNVVATTADVTCNSESDGLIDITVGGGVAPYSFSWSNNFISEDLIGLMPGNYEVVISDVNGCTNTSNYTIAEPDSLTFTHTEATVSCYGFSDGSIELSVSGGTAPYDFVWSNGSYNSDVVGLNAGTYTVTIKDAHLCSLVSNFHITQPDSLQLLLTSVSASCFNSTDGSIDLTMSGGIEPYFYSWSDGSIAEDLLLVAGGNYTVLITDANGCTQSDSTIIETPDSLNAIINVLNISCNVTKGSINLEVGGGTQPYSYSWSNGETTEDISNLNPGNFTVVYTDFNGCSGSLSLEILEIPDLTLTAESGNASTQGALDGSIDLTVSGGVEPYVFEWSNGTTTEDLNNVSGGIYSVTVTDASGCTAFMSIEVFETIPTSVQENNANIIIELLNYGHGNYSINITPDVTANYLVTLYDYSGRIVKDVYKALLTGNMKQEIQLDCATLTDGIYLMKVASEKSNVTMKLLISK